MKIALSYVKLRDTLDSTEPLNTTGLSALRGWRLTLDTETGFIQGILTRGEGEGAKTSRVEFHAAAAAHWQRESWAEPIDWGGLPSTAMSNADPASFLASKPKPTGGKRGKTSRGTSNRPNAAQPQPAPGAEPDRDG